MKKPRKMKAVKAWVLRSHEDGKLFMRGDRLPETFGRKPNTGLLTTWEAVRVEIREVKLCRKR